MKHTTILKEFFGLSQKSINLGGSKFELGKVYSNPYARAFNPQPTNENMDDDVDEYDADVLAHKLLSEYGYSKAAKLVSKHSIERHNKQI